jgi:hypothetical protein
VADWQFLMPLVFQIADRRSGSAGGLCRRFFSLIASGDKDNRPRKNTGDKIAGATRAILQVHARR